MIWIRLGTNSGQANGDEREEAGDTAGHRCPAEAIRVCRTHEGAIGSPDCRLETAILSDVPPHEARQDKVIAGSGTDKHVLTRKTGIPGTVAAGERMHHAKSLVVIVILLSANV